MRIVSLLPSLTELVAALGREEELVGISHECDAPPGIWDRPRLTRSRIDAQAPAAAIDAQVAAQGGSLYELDRAALAATRPTLILTQAQCDVCAVNEATVRDVAAGLPGPPQVLSVNPTDLEGVFTMFRQVAQALGGDAPARAERLIADFETTARAIARRTAGVVRPRVLFLEWPDPPYCAGHWIPELIALGGGVSALGRAGVASRRVSWEEVSGTHAEVAVVAPCGFSLEQARREAERLAERPAWQGLPAVRTDRVVLADGNQYFSRPGPRLEASLRIVAAAVDPERCGALAADLPDWTWSMR
ncbi:MAG: cobalamin-binding protein [Isosphaeraceae bacterium]|jgi:iron complex transport system substrate-binding protein|nr:MAG: cobalamin-binding protein [Isosphaeraceae bacterium]